MAFRPVKQYGYIRAKHNTNGDDNDDKDKEDEDIIPEIVRPK